MSDSFWKRSVLALLSIRPAERNVNDEVALRIDPEERGACTVVAEGARRGQRAEHVTAHRRAAQREPESDVGRRRIPAALAAPGRVQFVGLFAGPVASRHRERRGRQNARAIERAVLPEHLGEAEHVGHGRGDTHPRHLGVFFLERSIGAQVAMPAMADRIVAAKIRHHFARLEVGAQSHGGIVHLERRQNFILHDLAVTAALADRCGARTPPSARDSPAASTPRWCTAVAQVSPVR